MCPALQIFGRQVPSYWLCSLLGIAVSAAVLAVRHRDFRDLEQVDITNAAALSAVGMIIGARLLYLLTISPVIASHFGQIISDPSLVIEILSNGMVFYGGLAGALLVMHLYVRKYKLDESAFTDYFAPVFPLFHAFGRVGCFMTGCCYGIESDHFGIEFAASEIAPAGVKLFPVQILGAALELALFAVITICEKRRHREGRAMVLYLLIYSAGRFLIEFLRGDAMRGSMLGLSTSQWISIPLFIWAAAWLMKARRDKDDKEYSV